MNAVQLICLIIAILLFGWSLVTFVLYLVRKHKADKSLPGEDPEKGKEQ